jgi:hypothetical protein
MMSCMVDGRWLDSLLGLAARAHARRQYHTFLRAARNAVRTQEIVLKQKLDRNADSAFGREHGFSRIRSYADFVSRVPVRTYEELTPWVERLLAGEVTALLGGGQRVLMFAMTSGSTDRPKHVPITAPFLREYRRGWNAFGFKALLDHPQAFLRPILQIVSPMDEHRSKSGVPCGSISGLLAATQKRLVRKYYVTPSETGAIHDAEARYYTIMRFAVPQDVAWMVTASPATPVKLARTAAQHAENLIRDIHDGTLRPPGDVPNPIQRALVARLSPDPETAGRLSTIAERHGELLPRHYWKLAFLANWTGGTLGLHLRDFPRYFGDTPVRDIGLLATEGRVSIPLEDGTPAGVMDAAGSFFEFLDAEADSADRSAVHQCHELVVGNEYRVVMTTSAGFYRYDLGDRIRVRGYLGEAPVVEFLHRGAHVSSVTGEKLTEWQVTTAFDRTCRAAQVTLSAFVLAPVWGDPPFYRLHVGTALDDANRLAQLLDDELSKLNVEYGSKRSSGRLGPVVVNRLPDGFLARLDRERSQRRGASNEQYKHQYLYTKPGDDACLPLPAAPHEPCRPEFAESTAPEQSQL